MVTLLLVGPCVIEGNGNQDQQLISQPPWTPQYHSRADKDYEDKHSFGPRFIFYGRFKPIFHNRHRHSHHHHYQTHQQTDPESLRKDNFAGVQNLIGDLSFLDTQVSLAPTHVCLSVGK